MLRCSVSSTVAKVLVRSALVLTLPLAAAGCASADDATSGDTEDDLTSAEHGTAVQKCLDTESAAENALRVWTSAALTTIRTAAKNCIAKANDQTARQLDARQRGTNAKPALGEFSQFRTAATAACFAYIDAVDQVGIDPPFLKMSCGYYVEDAMARLIQTYAQLGGPPYADLRGIRHGEQHACYVQFKNNVSKIRACVETGVVQAIQTASPSSLKATVKAINVGNVALCGALVKRSTQAATVSAQDECRTEAAIFFEQLEGRQPH